MKKYIFGTALMCLMVACNTLENPIPETSDAVVYIKADSEEDITKGSVDGSTAAFKWNTGDRIAVYADGYKISAQLDPSYNNLSTANFGFSVTGDNALNQASRANFAIFPISLVYDGSGNLYTEDVTATSLKLNLPASYSLAQVQNDVSPTPMIATNTPNGNLAFKALCPLLRITVVNIPKQTQRIEFDFNGVNVQGEFTLVGVDLTKDIVENSIATSNASGSNGDIITVTMAGNTTWHDNLVINLPVPAGTYGNITITAKDEAGLPVLTLTKAIKAAGWAPTRKSSRKMTATLPVFSVADGKKVTFAPGNLVAIVSNPGTDHVEEEVVVGQVFTASKWFFANKQTDYNFTTELDGTNTICDHFGWVGVNAADDIKESYGLFNAIDDKYYGYTSSESIAHDWGEKVIYLNSSSEVSFESNTWRSPLKTDWMAVIDNRSSTTKFAKAKVGDVPGLIIFPDGFSVTDVSVNEQNNKVASFTSNEYVVAQWNKLELAGAVFLPAAGFREGTTVKGANSARYWTKTVYAKDMAFSLNCYNDQLLHSYGTRKVGYAVRLVRDLN